MDDTVFDVFQTTPYTFLQVKRGTVVGDVVESAWEATGVFKLRTGFVKGDTPENPISTATLHVRPSEDFLEPNNGNLIGHGVQHDGQVYEVIGQTNGVNYHSGVTEHITLTLQIAEFIHDSSS
jgi:hypothetical protein